MQYFKSLASNTFILITALLIIPSMVHAGSNNKMFLSTADDTLSPSSPTHLTFVGNTLSWTATTTNINGTPLEDLEGYRVYYGTESRKYKASYDVKNATTYKNDDLIDWNTYYFAVTAYDRVGNESPYSIEISVKKIPSQRTLTVNKGGTYTGVVTSEAAKVKKVKETKENPLGFQKPLGARFAVQVGAFRDASYAKALMAWLKEKGYSAYITLSGSKEGEKLHKVCIGIFMEREKAKTLSEKIKNSERLEAFVTLLQP